ncbi:MAG: hypothetical protein AAGM22_22085 [Acidobacteriota bacterium]
MIRPLATILCLLGAIGFYLLGSMQMALALFVIGGAFEIAFWILLLKSNRKKDEVFEP